MATCDRHKRPVCSECVIVTDAAKRMSDAINARLTFTANPWEIRNCFMAFRLSDGSSDGVLYDNKQDAIQHQLSENQCAYFCFRNAMGGVNPRDCQIFLDIHRHAYDRGGHLIDPDQMSGGRDFIMTTTQYDLINRRTRGRG